MTSCLGHWTARDNNIKEIFFQLLIAVKWAFPLLLIYLFAHKDQTQYKQICTGSLFKHIWGRQTSTPPVWFWLMKLRACYKSKGHTATIIRPKYFNVIQTTSKQMICRCSTIIWKCGGHSIHSFNDYTLFFAFNNKVLLTFINNF